MNAQIGSYEAKTRLPELLREVRKGKTFTITNRGKKIAKLVPAHESKAVNPEQATEAMKAFMRSNRIRGADVKALREEGRD